MPVATGPDAAIMIVRARSLPVGLPVAPRGGREGRAAGDRFASPMPLAVRPPSKAAARRILSLRLSQS